MREKQKIEKQLNKPQSSVDNQQPSGSRGLKEVSHLLSKYVEPISKISFFDTPRNAGVICPLCPIAFLVTISCREAHWCVSRQQRAMWRPCLGWLAALKSMPALSAQLWASCKTRGSLTKISWNTRTGIGIYLVFFRYVPPEVSESEDEESDEGVPGEGDLWGAIMGPSSTKYHKPEWYMSVIFVWFGFK